MAGDGSAVLRYRGTAYVRGNFELSISWPGSGRLYCQAVMGLYFCSVMGEIGKLKRMLVSSVPIQEIIHSGKLSSYT